MDPKLIAKTKLTKMISSECLKNEYQLDHK